VSHTTTPEQLQSVVAPLTVGGGVAPLTVGHFGSHGDEPEFSDYQYPLTSGFVVINSPTPYIPSLDTDPSCIARLSREIEALKAERDGLREALGVVREHFEAQLAVFALPDDIDYAVFRASLDHTMKTRQAALEALGLHG
jgi:hypothetical protein